MEIILLEDFLTYWKIKKLNKNRTKKGNIKLAPPAGLEPATYGLTVRRSTD